MALAIGLHARALFPLFNPLMLTNFIFRNARIAPAAILILAALVASCAVNLPPAPSSNPADPHAPEAATAPLRPTLLTTSHSFISPTADDREQRAKQMDMSKMKAGGMKSDMKGMSHAGHDMSGMQHGQPGMQQMSPVPATGETYFTCPMHAQIHEAKPGQCPICGMTLVKKSAEPEGAKP